jgi:uncharacterized protein YndB with AHSA1/START domain
MENSKKELVTIDAKVNAPVDKVWELWTGPEHIIKWNAASEDWHTTSADNDLVVGGKFSSRMEAKDGSFGFDFGGVYDEVDEHERIVYTLDDGRKVWTTFTKIDGGTEIISTFEAESQNPIEFQKAGWQSILNNFKNYAEIPRNWVKLKFDVEINAPVDVVYSAMIGKETYSQWTAEFNPTSRFEGSWDKGAKILFMGCDEDGNEGGMVSRIKENIPNKFVSIEHLGMLKDGEEITSGEEVEQWAGGLENYYFYKDGNKTKVQVIADSYPEFDDYFSAIWPKALNKLKQISEK